MNIFILDKNYNQIGMLSNEGANPQAPYFDDLYTQELDTGADTFYFTTLSTRASRDFIEIGNHIIFQFNNRHRLFAISDLEFEHKEGRNVIGVYAEGVGFQLLETFMGEFEGGDDTNGDGKVDKEDEGEGEFMTYEMFLEKVLKDTDWNYQIMSGDLTNINMGREVRFSNGKNIYALLQDSMQEFGGVELEFRAEYVGGGLNKTIYAYPHKGRGSFVGQRFEYGHNVAGIKKKQEVVDYMDENIILYEGLETVDGLNVEVTYEVDFALRSHEVEELEIGDTHYVIDNDFEPAQFEARIGKIEISFSDPTKNKCYIANFKKISGSTPDNVTGDNIEDVVDDKLDELIDDKLDELLGDGFKNHTHDRLVSENDGSKTPLVFKSGHGFTADNNKWHMAHLVTSDIGLNFGATDAPDHWTSVYIERSSSLANGAKATATVFTSDGNMLPDTNNQYIGASNRRWEATYSNYINAADSVDSPRYFGYNYQVRFDRDDMQNVTKVTDKQDLLDFIMNKVNVYTYSSKTIDDVVGAPDKMPYQEYYGLLAEDFTTHNSSTDCGGSEVAYNIMKNLLTDDTNGDGELNKNDGHNKHSYNLPALVTTLIGAFQQHVENGGENGGNVDLSAYATKTYVNDAIDDIELTPGPKGDKGEPGKDGVSVTNVAINSSNHLITTLSDNRTIDAGALPSGSGGDSSLQGHVDFILNDDASDQLQEITRNDFVKHSDESIFMNRMYVFGDIEQLNNFAPELGYIARLQHVSCVSFSCSGSVHADYLHVGGNEDGNASGLMLDYNADLILARKKNEYGESEYFRYTTEDLIRVFSSSAAATVNEDLLEEQQSTIQQQQETIASLEARIARLEEMLGINN